MVRLLDKRKHILVITITLVVFLLGVSLGTILDYERYRSVSEINDEQEIIFNSLQLQYLYLGELESEKDVDVCAAIYLSLEDSVKELGKSLDNILEYEKNTRLNKDSFHIIKRKYTLDNIRYWLFAKKAKESCGSELVTILYFFSDRCITCETQGTYLTHFKSEYQDKLLVFPLDVGIKDDEGMLRILMGLYNISYTPTLIIGDTRFEGLVERQELGELICDQFSNKSLCVT